MMQRIVFFAILQFCFFLFLSGLASCQQQGQAESSFPLHINAHQERDGDDDDGDGEGDGSGGAIVAAIVVPIVAGVLCVVGVVVLGVVLYCTRTIVPPGGEWWDAEPEYVSLPHTWEQLQGTERAHGESDAGTHKVSDHDDGDDDDDDDEEEGRS